MKWLLLLIAAATISLFVLYALQTLFPGVALIDFSLLGMVFTSTIAASCSTEESAVVCAREWLSPATGLVAVLTVWFAARQVLESNRQSDAAVRSALNQFRDDLIAEREALKQLSQSSGFSSLGVLRDATRGGYVHVEQRYDEIKAILQSELQLEAVHEALSRQRFGGELGQRRRELARLAHDIALDVFSLRQNVRRNEEPSAEHLDNIRFRTKHFFGQFHLYAVVIDEEIDTTAEAVSEFDDANLKEMRRRLVHRAERRWSDRRKGIFELLLQRISVPIDYGQPKRRAADAPREVSPHHVNPDFHQEREPAPRRPHRRS